MTNEHEGWARHLEAARQSGTLLGAGDRPWTALSVADGYAVQSCGLAHRLAEGERLAGWKMGFTSLAKMRQMNLDAPIAGYLLASMVVPEGSLDVTAYQQPKAEPEIVLRLKHDPGPTPDFLEASRAIEAVCLGLEILDSRYAGYQFSLGEVLADNTSAAGYVLGSRWRSPDALDLGNLGILMSVDGVLVEAASSAAIMDHPVRALMALARLLDARGKRLGAGQLVLTGGITAAHPLPSGHTVVVEAQDLGSITLATRTGA
ncbi:MAG: fumarylacetoacetate hydrolase family protein [Candidatus Sericytochromatia bacterium]|nr:fumarylacetoacetate hydrolase family protein [Candidatus Sericytochromatia bacterium]